MSEATTGRKVEASIEVRATPEQVWEMIATAEGLARWFPVEAKVTPPAGGRDGELWFSWGPGTMEGTTRIVTWEPPRRLVGTWVSMRDEYVIEGRGGTTLVRVTSSGFGEGAEWDEQLDSVTCGWAFELRGLRHALERHPGVRRDVVRATRHGAMSREEMAAAFLDGGLAPGVDLAALGEGDEAVLRLEGLGEVPVRVAVNNAPRDWSAFAPTLNDAYLRVVVEGSCTGAPAGQMGMWLWASTYGLAEERRGALSRAFEATADRVLARHLVSGGR